MMKAKILCLLIFTALFIIYHPVRAFQGNIPPHKLKDQYKAFLSKLREGDRECFLYVDYNFLDQNNEKIPLEKPLEMDVVKKYDRGFLYFILNQSMWEEKTLFDFLTNSDPDIRKNLVSALIPGLYNKDSRVQLVAINLLEKLRPDESMEKELLRALKKEFTFLNLNFNPELNESNRIRQYFLFQQAANKGFGIGHGRIIALLKLQLFDRKYKSTFDGPEEIKKITPKKHIYLYNSLKDPLSSKNIECQYKDEHSVLEKLFQLYEKVLCDKWFHLVNKNVLALRNIKLENFYTLTLQFDRRLIDSRPSNTSTIKSIINNDIRPIIVCFLENGDAIIRSECLKLLKQKYEAPDTSIKIRREIKKAMREARQRENIIGEIFTYRIKNYYFDNVYYSTDVWWAECFWINLAQEGVKWVHEMFRVKIDFNNNDKRIRVPSSDCDLEFPEETEIIYHHRRKPGMTSQ